MWFRQSAQRLMHNNEVVQVIKIVIVENKASDLENIQKMIATIPFAQLTGCYLSPKEAIDNALQDRPDILISEISLSDTNGLVMVQKFVNILPGIKGILLYKDGRFAKEAFEVGACDYIIKPITKNRLMKTLLKVG